MAIFVDPAGEAGDDPTLSSHGRRGSDSFDDVLYACKKRIIEVNLASEMNVLGREFHQLAMREWRTRDFTFGRILAALEEVVAAFPVYRTYVSQRGASTDDHRYIDWALGVARKRWRGADVSIFDFLRRILTGEAADPQDDASAGGRLYTAMHFQQVTGPVMAKAEEDTAFYRYVRLLALNEVGGDPHRFGMSVAAFHHLARAARPLLAASDALDRHARYQARRGCAYAPGPACRRCRGNGAVGFCIGCASTARAASRSTRKSSPTATSSICSINRCSGPGRPGSPRMTSPASTASPSGSKLI